METSVRVARFREFGLLRGSERDEAVMVAVGGMREALANLARLVGVVEASQSFRDDGHGSVRAWFQAVSNSSRGDAAALVSTARVLDGLPEWAGRLSDGEIGESQLREVRGLFANKRCRVVLEGQGQYALSYFARVLPFDDFKRVCERFRLLTDPDGDHRDHVEAHEARGVSTAFVGAEFLLRARGGVAAGAAMMAVLDAFVEVEFAADAAELRERCGENAPMVLLRRTHRQRRADALSNIFAVAASAAGVGKPGESLVNYLIDSATFADTVATMTNTDAQPGPSPDHPAAHGGSGPGGGVAGVAGGAGAGGGSGAAGGGGMTVDEWIERLRNCRSQTTTGVGVDPRVIVAAAINGRVRQIVVDPAGIVLHAGRRQRFFTGALRDVLQTVWERCFHPGCGVPATACEMDHVIGWSERGGLTDVGNGVPGCDRHNRWKHDHRFRSRIDEHGQIRTYRADETEIAPLQRPERERDDDHW